MPAPGLRSSRLDITHELFERAKIGAVKERRPLRLIFEEAVGTWLQARGC